MQIAWYSPTHDKIVVQDCSSYSEKIVVLDQIPMDNLNHYGAAVQEILQHMGDDMFATLLYGQGFHWLEQGLWVRLGEV